eukprot:m.22227 g.22227  ORF g.22227 m.22227 type:complete len:220 (+) comp7377_c1_seq1:127-786(+)
MEGYLWKRRRVVLIWAKRKFKLTKRDLEYESHIGTRKIPLNVLVSISAGEAEKGEKGYEIVLSTNSSVFPEVIKLYSETIDERNKWLVAIQNAIESLDVANQVKEEGEEDKYAAPILSPTMEDVGEKKEEDDGPQYYDLEPKKYACSDESDESEEEEEDPKKIRNRYKLSDDETESESDESEEEDVIPTRKYRIEDFEVDEDLEPANTNRYTLEPDLTN